MLNYVTPVEIAFLTTQTLCLVGIAFILYQFRRHRRFIGSLHSDLQRPYVTPEAIADWKKRVHECTPGSPKYKAYKASLKNVGEWDGD